MKQRLSHSLTLVLFTLFLLSPVFAAQVSAPPEVLKAAQAGLDDFCMSGTHEDQGIKLGPAFRMYTVNPQTLISETGKTLEAQIFPMDIWRFLVVNNDQAFGLLTVARNNNEWKAVTFGAAELAVEFKALNTAWPGESGFKFRFVRIYQAQSDFMAVSQGVDMLGYVPFKSARIALAIDSFNLSSTSLLQESEILEPIRQMVHKTISVDHQLDHK
jgi:hypothetical protein